MAAEEWEAGEKSETVSGLIIVSFTQRKKQHGEKKKMRRRCENQVSLLDVPLSLIAWVTVTYQTHSVCVGFSRNMFQCNATLHLPVIQ